MDTGARRLSGRSPEVGSERPGRDVEQAPPAAFTPYNARAYNLDASKIG